MITVSYEFYTETYRRNRAGGIPNDDFQFFIDAAYTAIDRKNAVLTEEEKHSERLWRLLCEIAELLYSEEQAPQAGDIISESNQGFSVSVKQSDKSNDVLEKDIYEITRNRLRNTPLADKFLLNILG
jgi:hypothetical protein